MNPKSEAPLLPIGPPPPPPGPPPPKDSPRKAVPYTPVPIKPGPIAASRKIKTEPSSVSEKTPFKLTVDEIKITRVLKLRAFP